MGLKSTPTRYGPVAIAIHWTTAAAILVMLASGLALERSGEAGAMTSLLRVHAIVGIGVGLLTLMRIVWWWAIDRRPDDVSGLSGPQALAAHLVHYALYAVVIMMVGSGLATLILSGANQYIFGAASGPLPSFQGIAPFAAHAALYKVLLVLVLGHVGAALWHQFIRRDRLLARMGLGSMRPSSGSDAGT